MNTHKFWLVAAASVVTILGLIAPIPSTADDDREGRWECYQGTGDDCKKVFVPANATVDSYGYWSCNRGYQLDEDRCVETVAPVNGTVSKNRQSWTCNKGYQEIDGHCIAECRRKPSTCMRSFIKKKDFASASYLYNENERFFQSDKEAKRREKELTALANRLNAEFSAPQQELMNKLQSTEFDSIDPTTWVGVRATISEAEKLISEYNSHKILKNQTYRSLNSIEFEARLQSVKDHISDQRQSAFLAYDHSGPSWFFKAYPVNVVDRSDFVRDIWRKLWPILNSMTNEDLFRVIEAWTLGSPDTFRRQFDADIATAFADAYFVNVVEEISIPSDDGLAEFLDAIAKANDIGLVPSEAISTRFLIVISAPPDELGLNFNLQKLSKFQVVREVPVDALSKSYDMVIILGVTSAKLQERTVDTKSMPSTYEAGLETAVNPAYLTAQSKYNLALDAYGIAQSNYSIAQANLRSCQATQTYCIAESWQAGATSGHLGNARNALSSAQRALESTSTSVTKPVVENYQVQVAKIAIDRFISGKAIVLTPGNKGAWVDEFQLTNTDNLNIAINPHPKDYGVKQRYQSPDKLKAKESDKFRVDVFDVLGSLATKRTRIESVEDLQRLIAATPKREQQSPASSASTSQIGQSGVGQAPHPSIGGVVVVQTPLGGRGAGFYVADSLLVTNYHVVANSGYVEVIQFDGSRATGQVKATDIDRDLALVQTSTTGQALDFFDGNFLPLGDSVIAIGHPSGLDFSLTKGIISAVREHSTTTSSLGKNFLFIQTDAAISPGNSGGPLLLNNKVIGINTQKLVDMQVEGIGFALHYAEIARFLAVSTYQ